MVLSLNKICIFIFLLLIVYRLFYNVWEEELDIKMITVLFIVVTQDIDNKIKVIIFIFVIWIFLKIDL